MTIDAGRMPQNDEMHGFGTLGQVILTAIGRFGDRDAIADGDRRWSYSQLGEAVARCIAALNSLGVRKGDGIAMAAGNRVDGVAAQYAALLMGVRFTALHLMSSREVHEFVLADSGASLLLIDPELDSAKAGSFKESVESLRHVLAFGPSAYCDDFLALCQQVVPTPLKDEADPGGVAYLYYTGGTTGRPKGVKLTHRSLVMATLVQAADWDLTGEELRFLAATPTSHASGIIVPTILMRGGFVRLMRGFDAEAFCQVTEQDRITCAFIVPTMLYVLLDFPARSSFDLSSLSTVIYGAAPMSPDRMRQAIGEFGQIFVQLYGQTEVPMGISALRKVDHDPDNPDQFGTAGRPCPAMQVKLFDSEMNEVPHGQPGEICVRGPLVMDGYWNREDSTAETWRGGWHHTGDVAVLTDAGCLKIVDRTSDLIITGGYNVYPREVEDALLAHPAVSAAAVIGIPDEKWGEAVTAFVVIRPQSVTDEKALRNHVKDMRGAVWTPKSVHFLPELPLTPLGKVDRKALKQINRGVPNE